MVTAVGCPAPTDKVVTVGNKKFTEQFIAGQLNEAAVGGPWLHGRIEIRSLYRVPQGRDGIWRR